MLAEIEVLGIGENQVSSPLPASRSQVRREGQENQSASEINNHSNNTLNTHHNPISQRRRSKVSPKKSKGASSPKKAGACTEPAGRAAVQSQSQNIAPAQSSTDHWVGAVVTANAGGVITVEASQNSNLEASQHANAGEPPPNRSRARSRRIRGVLYGPADWNKRRVTQPRKCKACQCVVVRDKFGIVCRTCGDFVCSVPCKKRVMSEGGCSCLLTPTVHSSAQQLPQPATSNPQRFQSLVTHQLELKAHWYSHPTRVD